MPTFSRNDVVVVDVTGTHRIDVDYAGSPIPGSPFFATSFDSSKVAVRGIRDAVVGTRTSFTGQFLGSSLFHSG